MSVAFFSEDVSVSGSDADVQLLEAAKTGDLEVVKVIIYGSLMNIFKIDWK